MTASTAQRAKPAPRVLLKVFWAIHRAIVRVTGGRIGLTRAVSGKRFGMLRLTTVGRRSGERRQAMIGPRDRWPKMCSVLDGCLDRPEPVATVAPSLRSGL